MLEIKKITKIYDTGEFKQKALDNISVNFRECEFASILGQSGSGKTTFLNIIGGLDHYTSGDLIINEISTKKFKDSDWDSYRNHRIGFVFQSYNLISHQTVLANVRLALTLSGISKKESINRAKKALKDVGLEKHMYKKPNQLSGGQMQRVAIARALVNDPEILLADEPTGALDSETSIQIMELLKKISTDKLVIMVTHNPELAEMYSTRIINLKDGHIVSDSNPYDGKIDTKENKDRVSSKNKKTSMSFLTALSLSFNNLMTKKGRTILVAFAGSIGIIGIALILAVSTGFQNYIDSIQEDTLTSYPLTIMQESADITGVLLSMTNGTNSNDKSNLIKENQIVTNMLGNISANDLKSFNEYLRKKYSDVEKDISTITYSYSIDPLIYTVDAKKELTKVNPSDLFSSFYNTNMLSSYSSFTSIYSQMMDNYDVLNEQYDVLAGHWPKNYDEMIIVLPERNSIPDLLIYSLGLRDMDELTDMISKIMSGETVSVHNDPMTFTYEDLMNIDLRLIENTDLYKYNKNYNVYTDMSNDADYMKDLYNKSTKLKIVGVVSKKEGTNSMALTPGVVYTKELIEHIIDYSSATPIVKEQLKNQDIDVFSGKPFKTKDQNLDLGLSDIITIDNKKLESAFNIKLDQSSMQKMTMGYINDMSNAITTDTTPAKETYTSVFIELATDMLNKIENVSINEIDGYVNNYLNSDSAVSIIKKTNKYALPKSAYDPSYSSLLKLLLQNYISTYYAVDSSLTVDQTNLVATANSDVINRVIDEFKTNPLLIGAEEQMARIMTETLMKKTVGEKVGELTQKLTSSIASAFNVDQDKIASSFQLKFSEEELTRIISAMFTDKEANAKSNLLSLGYQNKEEPTMISFYFNSFDGKEHFLSFIDSYNEEVKKNDEESKVINYTDTTGILMGSVKTIVNAVSYVLIAFVSISLVVSSIMIGIITYISVYERTKEIGILRSIGASKHNISSIFNAETFIIGLLSGIFGIGVCYILIPIINAILHHYTGNIPLSASLQIKSGLILIILSIILTLIGGLIPSKAASKKDPVEALRSE